MSKHKTRFFKAFLQEKGNFFILPSGEKINSNYLKIGNLIKELVTRNGEKFFILPNGEKIKHNFHKK